MTYGARPLQRQVLAAWRLIRSAHGVHVGREGIGVQNGGGSEVSMFPIRRKLLARVLLEKRSSCRCGLSGLGARSSILMESARDAAIELLEVAPDVGTRAIDVGEPV